MKSWIFVCLTICSIHFCNAQSITEQEHQYLLELYKHFHQHPELSQKEENTAKRLAQELTNIGYAVTSGIGGHGVVAMLKNGDGPQILYRADMDALPVDEATGLPYASKVTTDLNGAQTGVMHACGHDIHMTTLIGVARQMANNRKGWKGTLMLVLQPAEEIGAGARLMLEDNLYERFGVPDYGIAFHANAELPAGDIGIREEYIMANAEFASITVYGKGGHGAAPHLTIDPVVMSSMIILELQTIVSRSVKPVEDAVITVGKIQGGTKNNVIPDSVHMELTLRSFTEEVRLLLRKRIDEICRGIAIAAGMSEDKLPRIVFSPHYAPAVYNDPQLTERFVEVVSKTIGKEKIHVVEPVTIAEDFSRFGLTKEKVPILLFWLGTVPAERIQSGDMPGLHTSRYYPDAEKSISTGVQVVTAMLYSLMQ